MQRQDIRDENTGGERSVRGKLQGKNLNLQNLLMWRFVSCPINSWVEFYCLLMLLHSDVKGNRIHIEVLSG